MKTLNTQYIKNIMFLSSCLFFLLIGLFGVTRLPYRSKPPFTWNEQDGKIKVSKIDRHRITEPLEISEGDILLEINQYPINNPIDVELMFLCHNINKSMVFTYQRQKEVKTFSSFLTPYYSLRFIILNLVLGFLFWIIGIFVYFKKSDDKSVRIFSWGCVISGISILMVWHNYPYTGKIIELIIPIMYSILYPLCPGLILYFTSLYPHEKSFFPRKNLPFLIFLPSLIFICFFIISYMPVILTQSSEWYSRYQTVNNAFRGYFILYLLLSLFCLVHSLKTAISKPIKNRIQWVFYGIGVGTFPFIFFWTLPQLLGFSPWLPEEVVFLILVLTPLSIGFSIVKYHLMDIQIILNRSLVYFVLSGTIIVLYLILAGLAGHFLGHIGSLSSNFFVIIFALIAALLFSQSRQYIQTFVDKTFFRVNYNYRLAIKDHSRSITTIHHKKKLTQHLLNHIHQAIPVSKIGLLVFNQQIQNFQLLDAIGFDNESKQKLQINLNTPLVRNLQEKQQPFIKAGRYEYADKPELTQNTLLNEQIELVIPLFLDNQLKGILIIGKKRSGLRFTEEDLELMTQMLADCLMTLERLTLQKTMILEHAEKTKHQELSRLKSEFISHVSHELKTPITTMRWSLENLLDGIPKKPDPKVKIYLENIYENTCHLGRMIENLLDIGRIEEGRIEINPEKLNLAQEVKKTFVTLQPLASAKSINMEFSSSKEWLIKMDRDALQAILTNLLENAIKYSFINDNLLISAQQIEKSKKTAVVDSSRDMIAISITDHGPGIPPKKQNLIFERFERIKQMKSKRTKGLGLGLYIVRKLVELHGGTIRVKSKLGKGSTFTLTLPLWTE